MSDLEDASEMLVLMKVLDLLRLRREGKLENNNETARVSSEVNRALMQSIMQEFFPDHIVGREGEIVMGDKYEIHGQAQVGAVGKGASVTSLSFNSAVGEQYNVDIGVLAGELRILRAEMRKNADDTEHDAAVVAVGQALAAAENGESDGIMKHLRSAGAWALGLATSIGATVAAAAIKSALDIK